MRNFIYGGQEHRLPAELSSRLYEYATLRIAPCDTDAEQIKEEKAVYRNRLDAFCTSIHSKTNPVSKKASLKEHARILTFELLFTDFVWASGLTPKDILEICAFDNLKYTPEQCLVEPKPSDWFYVTWPNDDCTAVYNALVKLSPRKQSVFNSYVKALLPARYQVYLEELQQPLHIYDNDTHSYYYPSESETRSVNMGDRIRLMIEYREISRLDPRIVKLTENKLFPTEYREHRVYHYNQFPITILPYISQALLLPLHFMLVGDEDVPILAESAKIEKIMDNVTMLSENNIRLVRAFIEQM